MCNKNLVSCLGKDSVTLRKTTGLLFESWVARVSPVGCVWEGVMAAANSLASFWEFGRMKDALVLSCTSQRLWTEWTCQCGSWRSSWGWLENCERRNPSWISRKFSWNSIVSEDSDELCPYSVYKEDIDAAEAATDKKVDNILVHQLGKDIIESEIKDKFDKLGVTSDCDPDQNKKRVFWWIWQCEHLRN